MPPPPPRTQSLGEWRVDPEVQENANKQNACTGCTGLSLQWRAWPVGGDEQTENFPICLRGSSLSPRRPLRLGARWHPCSSSGPGPSRSNIKEAVFLGLSPRRDRVPKGVRPEDWEAIKFSDEETLTRKQLRVIFEVIYFTWFIGRVFGSKGNRNGWCVCVWVWGHFNVGSFKNCPEENVIWKKKKLDPEPGIHPTIPTCICDGGKLPHKLGSGLLLPGG